MNASTPSWTGKIFSDGWRDALGGSAVNDAGIGEQNGSHVVCP